jgi:hypothetical protein
VRQHRAVAGDGEPGRGGHEKGRRANADLSLVFPIVEVRGAFRRLIPIRSERPSPNSSFEPTEGAR